jgi:tRNA 2-thiouridine synthesizing protein D
MVILIQFCYFANQTDTKKMKKSLSYTILITSCPFNGNAAVTALEFCKALLKREHRICSLFFYFNASLFGNDISIYPVDEVNLQQQWQQFANENKISFSLCASSSLRRGVIDEAYGKQYGKKINIASGFEIKGLTDLLFAISASDRFIQFGEIY